MGNSAWGLAVAVQYVLAGFSLQLALLFALWWFRRRSDRHVLSLGLWCLSLVPLLASSAVLYGELDRTSPRWWSSMRCASHCGCPRT